jgi:hypothetical protein
VEEVVGEADFSGGGVVDDDGALGADKADTNLAAGSCGGGIGRQRADVAELEISGFEI